jgi:hypothetical protein
MLVSTNPKYREIHKLLHTLWTKAVGSETYNKKEWNRLDELIHDQFRSWGEPGV